MQNNQSLYIETFGCQMNIADTEIVLSIMRDAGYTRTDRMSEADVMLVNTCSVRDNAEQRVISRLGDFSTHKRENPEKIIGVLGCMAERTRKNLIESIDFIDIVIGPDEYRKLPGMIGEARNGAKGIAVKLSRHEKYDDIPPLRTDRISAWVPIMRGCDKFCSYCVVPYTRGRERSRALSNIRDEIEGLSTNGFKEVTLLGQNVNSYRDGANDFADLLNEVSGIDSTMRVRFMTSHPKDMSDKLIDVIRSRDNICNSIHLPVQSGSNRILDLMNRSYTKEHYLGLLDRIRKKIPEVYISTDIIAGFPTETEDDHKHTLDLVNEVEFDNAFTFKYSPRENTKAWDMGDNVPDDVKHRRLGEIIDSQRTISLKRNLFAVGKTVKVLIEGSSKRSEKDLCGRTDANRMVIFPRNGDAVGSYTDIFIEKANSATLFGKHVSFTPEKAVTFQTQKD